MDSHHDATILQHTGRSHRIGTGLIGAVEHAVTFQTPSSSDYPIYARLGNTANHAEIQSVIAALHGAESALVFGSGMAAMTAAAMTLLRPGDHLLAQQNCYGGIHQLFSQILQRWGVEVTFAQVADWAQAGRKNTKLCTFESISNPFCLPQDIETAVAAAKGLGAKTLCDNTFASPVHCKPLTLGVDLVLESATKYLNGHSDVVAGAVAGSQNLCKEIWENAKLLGGFLPAASCGQLLRGMRTLTVRMQTHAANGARFAAAMKTSPLVSEVFYGTSDARIGRCFTGGFGGMCAVRFAPRVNVPKLVRATKLVSDVPSLAGTETTVTMPIFTTNRWLSEAERRALGIDTSLVRFSLGLEAVDDVIADVLRALEVSL